MQIVWLGQGGLLLVSKKYKILVDPYMSNSLKKIDRTFKRRIKVKGKFFKVKPDIILLTNSHPDHTDIKTLTAFLGGRSGRSTTVISCENAFRLIADAPKLKRANHIMFGEGDEWSFNNLHIKAVKARTDDRTAFGVIITDETDGKIYYIASNTLYNEEIFASLPEGIFAAFIPISGMYGCMNAQDAKRFATRLGAEYVIPINYGMFDTLDPGEFKCAGRVLPKPYKAIEYNLLPVQSLFAPNVFDKDFNEKSEIKRIKEQKKLEKEAKKKEALAKKEAKKPKPVDAQKAVDESEPEKAEIITEE